jgi:hypothetical protein
MDQELDDLLDSALNDFEAKKETVIADESVTANKSKVTIERTNLYVDDVDDEDRPVRKTMPDLTKSTFNKNTTSTSASASATTNPNLNDDMKIFDEIFNDEKSKESMKQFKAAFEMLQSGGDNPDIMQNFQKVLTDLANTDLGEDDEDDDDFENIEGFDFLKNLTKTHQTPSQAKTTTSTTTTLNNAQNTTSEEKPNETKEQTASNPLKKVLEDMNKNSEKVLKNSESFPFGADFLSSLTSSLNETGENDDENLDSASSLMMQPILSMLFSKEILYPSLKLMLENYDKYIENKKEKLNEEELKKCYLQKECIAKMCHIYEESKETDTQEAKTAQLKNILDLLEKCGVFLNYLNLK